MHIYRRLLAVAILLGFGAGASFGISASTDNSGVDSPLAYSQRYYQTEVLKIPMRDGVELVTEIHRPREQAGPLPFLMVRTPYGASGERFSKKAARYRTLAEEGYIFVIQEMRGTHGSEGEFIMNPPPKSVSGNEVDEATDTYDTIEWLLQNVENSNGRVGVTGCSYYGYSTVMAGMSGHPALKAISPQASMADLFRGDDFYWNGIPHLLGPLFSMYMETRGVVEPVIPKADAFEWFLQAGALNNVENRIFGDKQSGIWKEMLDNTALTPFWQSRVLANYAKDVKVPTLHVLGWYDVEDFAGPIRLFGAMDAVDKQGDNRLIVGPWRHCQWLRPDSGEKLGNLYFGSPTIKTFREEVEAKWFAWYLKDKGSLSDLPQVVAFETGANQWKSYQSWPPKKGIQNKIYYLADNKRLSQNAGITNTSRNYDQYISDPLNPVPYADRPIGFYSGKGLSSTEKNSHARSLFIIADQRFAHDRPDVLTWVSEPLTEDMILNGSAMLELFAETTGSDVDWIAHLIDVYPDDFDEVMSGYRLPVTRGALRASLREDMRTAKAVTPGKVEKYEIGLESRSHRFLKGHRVMLQLQSTWFPYLTRNPQKFIKLSEATDDDFQVVTNKIHRGKAYPSRLELPISPVNKAGKVWHSN